jgi:hypothetical protein
LTPLSARLEAVPFHGGAGSYTISKAPEVSFNAANHKNQSQIMTPAPPWKRTASAVRKSVK